MVPGQLLFYQFQSNATARKALARAMSIHAPCWLTMCNEARNAFYCSHIHIKHLLLNQAGCLGCFFLMKSTFSHSPFPITTHTVNTLIFKTKIPLFALNPSSSLKECYKILFTSVRGNLGTILNSCLSCIQQYHTTMLLSPFSLRKLKNI